MTRTDYVGDLVAHLLDLRPFSGATALWTDGKTVWSYNTAIAAVGLADDSDRRLVVVTDSKLSKTTDRYLGLFKAELAKLDTKGNDDQPPVTVFILKTGTQRGDGPTKLLAALDEALYGTADDDDFDDSMESPESMNHPHKGVDHG